MGKPGKLIVILGLPVLAVAVAVAVVALAAVLVQAVQAVARLVE